MLAAFIVTAAAMSFAWGMRGLIIGGEKGAMLPGAVLGLCMSRFVFGAGFTGTAVLAAVGAAAMSFGGIDPYGENMGFVLHPEREGYSRGPAHGYPGIFIKGGVWFGIALSFLCLVPGITADAHYTVHTAVFFLLLPELSALGRFIFNRPYDPEKGLFPKLYFSLSSREEWGGNLIILVCTALFSLFTGNNTAAAACLFGFVSGGIGFCAGLFIYRFIITGRLLKRLSARGICDGWKVMEHTFGAISGGLSVLFLMYGGSRLRETYTAEAGGGYIWTILISVSLLLTVFRDGAEKLYTKKTGREADDHTGDIIERPFYSSFVLALSVAGGVAASAVPLLVYLPYTIFEKTRKKKGTAHTAASLFSAEYLISSVVLTIYLIVSGKIFAMPQALYAALFTLPFAVEGALMCFTSDGIIKVKAKEKKPSEIFSCGLTVHPHFLVLAAAVTLYFIF